MSTYKLPQTPELPETPDWRGSVGSFCVKHLLDGDRGIPELAAARKVAIRVMNEIGEFGHHVLDNHSFDMRVTPGQVGEKTIFLVTIRCYDDGEMKKAVMRFGTPRGFHWVVTDDQCIPLAFYPKFANDLDRAEKVTCPETTAEINCYLEWSGYQGLVTVVRVDGVLVLVTCTKYSVDSDYAKPLDAMVRKWMTSDLASYLADHGVTLAFEVMTKWAATHGAPVSQDAMVLTGVSTATLAGDGESYLPQYLTQEEVYEFGEKYKVPHSCRIAFTGDDAWKLFSDNKLQDILDKGDLDDFYAMCKEVGAEVRPGSVRHEDVLGTCLKGIEVHYNSTDGENLLTQKLKFVSYVVRIALRDSITKAWRRHHDAFTQKAIQEIVDFITETVSRCTTSEEVTKVWIPRVLMALGWAIGRWDAYQSETREGIHIQAFEAITAKEEVFRR